MTPTTRTALRAIVATIVILAICHVATATSVNGQISYEKPVEISYTIPETSPYEYGFTQDSRALFVDIHKIQYPKIFFCGDMDPGLIYDPYTYPSGSCPITLSRFDNRATFATGYVSYNIHFENNQPKKLQMWITIETWDRVAAGTGTTAVRLDGYNLPVNLHLDIGPFGHSGSIESGKFYFLRSGGSSKSWVRGGNYIQHSFERFEHDYNVDDCIDYYNIFVDKKDFKSTVRIYDETGNYWDETESNKNISLNVYKQPLKPPLVMNVTDSYGNIYLRNLHGDTTPDTPTTDNYTITIYVKNSQTGAAIANSNVVIDALVNGEYYPVANTTEPSGIFTITLQPTGGGQPNPDGYRLIAIADGYNNPMPEINFTVTDSKKYIYCYLDPIAGGPENENNTFIDFYVRDLSANPVSGATVKFGKYTLITNSQGYTVFEVPKNSDYTYTVSKSGYGPVTGNANIGANDRYIINAVIGPSVTQTTPTAIPTDNQTGPTPTLTAPTGEPVSNLLEWFAAHFGMLLGGGVEIGKIFMWLCFAVPVGVYVGKEAKAGAAGFMAGAGIVTLFFVLIGWVPIWIVVLLALIIGLLYAKVFNNSNTGGGR